VGSYDASFLRRFRPSNSNPRNISIRSKCRNCIGASDWYNYMWF
jgi:hypothetical protein